MIALKTKDPSHKPDEGLPRRVGWLVQPLKPFTFMNRPWFSPAMMGPGSPHLMTPAAVGNRDTTAAVFTGLGRVYVVTTPPTAAGPDGPSLPTQRRPDHPPGCSGRLYVGIHSPHRGQPGTGPGPKITIWDFSVTCQTALPIRIVPRLCAGGCGRIEKLPYGCQNP